MRFTADLAANEVALDLDERIRQAVYDRERGQSAAYLRVNHHEARFIERELSDRGFFNIRVPDIVLSGDVYFEWHRNEEAPRNDNG